MCRRPTADTSSKKFLLELLPYITNMCNALLAQGTLLISQRQAETNSMGSYSNGKLQTDLQLDIYVKNSLEIGLPSNYNLSRAAQPDSTRAVCISPWSLDFSSTFHMVYHSILIERLQNSFDIQGNPVLDQVLHQKSNVKHKFCRSSV